jgi:hypothetical protein
VGCAGLRCFAHERQAGFDWAALGCAGVGGKREWLLGRAQPPGGFRPTVSLVFKIPFLF